MAGRVDDEQRPPEDRIWGADRVVLYLEGPTQALNDLDGSREQDFRTEVRKFLDSPAAAFDKHPADYIGHIRELGSKTRGFATWCQNEKLNRELCVVHEVYKKENESEYWPHLEGYDDEGRKFARKFGRLDSTKYEKWISSLHSASDKETVMSD
jgi:hypothetical protein